MRTRRTVALTAAIVAPVLTATAAHAAGLAFTSPVSGTATIAKTGQTTNVPAGSLFKGELNGDTVTGSALVPTTTARVRLLDIGEYGDGTATVKIQETRPSVTKIKGDGSADGTAYFKIQVLSVYADLLPGVNLVSPTCTSGEVVAPIHADKLDLFNAFPATSTFTIPAFTGCGIKELGAIDPRDQLITDKVSGPGNTMNLVVGPAVLG